MMRRYGIWICATTIALGCAADDGGSGEASGSSGGGSSSGAMSATLASAPGDSSGMGSTSGAVDTSTGGGLCTDELPAIVTDIDETLTLSDGEFLMQINDPTYDPVEREGGSALINGYADLGYRILYLTARGENVDIADTDETSHEITVRWLMEHGYPLDPDSTMVVLAPTLLIGDAAQTFKGDQLTELEDMGWRFDYAYGNATSDIGAYADAGIDKSETFIIGQHAGEDGTVAVDGEDWLAHTAERLPMVPAVCDAA